MPTIHKLIGYVASILGFVLLFMPLYPMLYPLIQGQNITFPSLFQVVPYIIFGLSSISIGVVWLSVDNSKKRKQEANVGKDMRDINVNPKMKAIEGKRIQKKFNFAKIGIIVIILGSFVLIVAGFAYMYEGTVQAGYVSIDVPIYREYTFPLILGSAALFVMGFALIFYKVVVSKFPTNE